MTETAVKTLIFEDKASARRALAYSGRNSVRAIPFSVEGMRLFKKAGLESVFPDELVTMPDLNRIGERNIGTVRNVCAYLDKRLQDKIPYLSKGGYSCLGAAEFRIKVFFDTVMSTYTVLDRILDDRRDEEVIAFRDFGSFSGAIDGETAATELLLEHVFKKKYPNIRMADMPTENNIIPSGGYLEASKRSIHRIMQILSSGTITGAGKEGVLDLCDSHDIPCLAEDTLSDKNWYSIFLDGDPVAPHAVAHANISTKAVGPQAEGITEVIKSIFREAKADNKYKNYYDCGEEVYYLINRCLEEHAISVFSRLLPVAEGIKDVIKKAQTKIAVTSHCRMNLINAFIFETARSLGIPIIAYQEGGGGGYMDWPLFQLDIRLADHFLVYGAGVKESPFINGGSKVQAVGSLRLANLEKGLRRKVNARHGKICVILDNIKTGTYQHYPNNGGFFSSAYKHQLKILDLLQRFGNVRFVIKTVPRNKSLYDDYRGANISIETRPLAGILDDMDAFVLDSGTTVLQECLLTDKPIALLYDSGGIAFEKYALELLAKRVRLCSDPALYGKVIENIIHDAMNSTPMAGEREFIDNYCLMSGVGDNLRSFFRPFFSGGVT